jgi:hypothetical protein
MVLSPQNKRINKRITIKLLDSPVPSSPEATPRQASREIMDITINLTNKQQPAGAQRIVP